MKSKTFALALALSAGAAFAQPGTFTDLGTRTTTQTFTQDVTLTAPNDIQWFRIVLPAVDATVGWVDIWTAAVGDITDTEIGLYDATGLGATATYFDDDSGPGFFSQLTFGSTVARTNLGGAALARNGSDGALAGGEYYLAFGRYDVTFAEGFAPTSNYAGTQTTSQLNFDIGAPTEPLPPTATATATPNSAAPGEQVVYAVTVVPGSNPTSTGIVVVGDLSGVGGPGSASFLDNGLNGDDAAGDGIYSYRHTIPAATPGGGYTVAITVTDAQSRNAAASIVASVFNPVVLGTLTMDYNEANTVPAAAGLWYRFTLANAVTVASGEFFDIDTNGSGIDTELALFDDATGVLIAADDDGGVGVDSLLTFGAGGGTAQTDAGSGSTGDDGELAAGTYLLCLSQYNSLFADGPSATFPAAGVGGAVVLTITMGEPAPVEPPVATDLGEIGAGAGGTEVVTTIDAPITAGTITWYEFSIGADALNASSNYLDIDTEPTAPDGPPAIGSINDTELAVYSPEGVMLDTDDDDGTDFHTQLTYGDNTNIRPAIGNAAAAGGNGRDGDLLTGSYYLAVACYNAAFNPGFAATTTSAAEGTVQVNFRTNLPGGGGPGACSEADIGIAGGLPGQDHILDNNDFIAFINYFFAMNPVADMGVAGGLPGSDSQWDNNDFIAFIGHFFDDVAACNG